MEHVQSRHSFRSLAGDLLVKLHEKHGSKTSAVLKKIGLLNYYVNL